MIQSYKQKHTILDHYDTILIGSGIGSMTAAAVLAKEGQKALVLERHYTAGGFTHIFKRRGYEWDVGVHYIGEVQRPNSAIKKMFDYISDGELKWADMGEVYDRIILGEESFDLVKGVDNFKNKIISYFPKEEKAISEYVHHIFAANKTSRNFYSSKAIPPLLEKISGGLMRKPFLKYSDRTTYDFLKSLTDNEKLIQVLCGQYGDYGLPPKQSSFAMHASVVRHYFSGGSFPIGGSSKISETIAQVIHDNGGAVLISAEVDKVIIEKNRALGVRMANGKEIRANNVISGAGIVTTINKLLDERTVEQHQLKNHLQSIKQSVAHACLYIGLKGSPDELELPRTNLWIYPGDVDHDTSVERYLADNNAPLPVVYISFPSAKDPDWSNRYPDRSTIDIITLVPYDLFAPFDGTRWKKRGAEYEAIKENIAQRLLEALFKQLPHLRDKVDFYELSSPLTTKHFVNYDKGEIYGLDHSPKRFRQKFLKPRTPIKNFYLTGQDIVTAGVGGALFAGVLTASAMTGSNLVKKIMESKLEQEA